MAVVRKDAPDSKSFIRGLVGEDVEYINPVEHFRQGQIRLISAAYRDLLNLHNVEMTAKLPERFFIEKAEKDWEGIYNGVMAAKVPANFMALLLSESKKEQERLMRAQSITPDELGAFIFRAWNEHGYTMSTYHFKSIPSNVDEKDLPKAYMVEGDTVTKMGDTTLSDGKLRAVLRERKVIVARILDKGKEWHCFFQTYRSLRGEETWREGQPHLHYLSDKWGVPREQVVERIKQGDYPATSVHIALTNY